jgi:hypothetical protein
MFLTTLTRGTRMIVHFSTHLFARGVRGTRDRIALRASGMKGILGAWAGDFVRLRIGSQVAAVVAAVRLELNKRVRRRTPFCLPGSGILRHSHQRLGSDAEARNQRQLAPGGLARNAAQV